jgi:hypothetical protein
MFACFALALLATSNSPAAQQARHVRPPSPSAGHVLVVGPGGHASIQSAIDASEDGDTVLVKPGTWAGFTIHDKALSVVADTGPAVEVSGSVDVSSLSAGKAVLLAGFTIRGSGAGPALVAEFDDGGVRVEECTILGPSGSAGAPAAVDAAHCLDIAFTACTMQGGTGGSVGFPDGPPGCAAVSLRSASAAIQDSVLRGGNGGDAYLCWNPNGPGGPGGAGCVLEEARVFLSGSMVYGGRGGAGGGTCFTKFCPTYGPPREGGPGGDGLRVVAPSPWNPCIARIGTPIVPGVGGSGGTDHANYSYCYDDAPDGPPGTDIVADPGTVESFTEPSRRMVAPRVARDSTTVTLSCYGQTGDEVFVLAASAPGYDYRPNLHGVALTGPADPDNLASGTISASGSVHLSVPLGDLRADSRTMYLQAYFLDVANRRFLASQITLVELDSRF